MRLFRWAPAAGVVVAAVAATALAEYKSGIVWPEPPVVTPGATAADPPSDAVVLFDGTDLSKWVDGDKWLVKDGYAEGRKTAIRTKEAFGDCQLHLEFATPAKVESSGQGRGNNGVYFMGHYEIQILDSYQNPTYFDGQCASVYKQSPPMVNASRKPGEWQTYDIAFEAPRFADDGKLLKPAVATVFHNGVLVQNHFVLSGDTFYDKPPAYTKHPERLPLHLYYHGNAVRFRNIWLRDLKPLVGTKPGDGQRPRS